MRLHIFQIMNPSNSKGSLTNVPHPTFVAPFRKNTVGTIKSKVMVPKVDAQSKLEKVKLVEVVHADSLNHRLGGKVNKVKSKKNNIDKDFEAVISGEKNVSKKKVKASSSKKENVTNKKDTNNRAFCKSIRNPLLNGDLQFEKFTVWSKTSGQKIDRESCLSATSSASLLDQDSPTFKVPDAGAGDIVDNQSSMSSRLNQNAVVHTKAGGRKGRTCSNIDCVPCKVKNNCGECLHCTNRLLKYAQITFF